MQMAVLVFVFGSCVHLVNQGNAIYVSTVSVVFKEIALECVR